MVRVLVLAGFLIILPIGLNAQARGAAHAGGPAPSAGAAVSHGAVAHANSAGAPRPSVARGSSSTSHLTYYRRSDGQLMVRRVPNGAVNSSHRENYVSEDAANSVPGLGFDYSHVAATRPRSFNGLRDRDRFGRNQGAIIFPYYGGGYYLPDDSGVGADNGDEGQPVDDSQLGYGYGDPQDHSAQMRGADRPAQPQPAEPPADVPEYVFVRRDGTVFFAVGYSWVNGSLRYVSSEGFRRTVPRDSLDLDATQQFNEQRGMTFRAPA